MNMFDVGQSSFNASFSASTGDLAILKGKSRQPDRSRSSSAKKMPGLRRCHSTVGSGGTNKPRTYSRSSSDRKLLRADNVSTEQDLRPFDNVASAPPGRIPRTKRSKPRKMISETSCPATSRKPPGLRRCQTDTMVRRSKSAADDDGSRSASPEQSPSKADPSSSFGGTSFARRPVRRTQTSTCSARTRSASPEQENPSNSSGGTSFARKPVRRTQTSTCSARTRSVSPKPENPSKADPSSSSGGTSFARKPIRRTKSSSCDSAQPRIPRNARRGLLGETRSQKSTSSLLLQRSLYNVSESRGQREVEGKSSQSTRQRSIQRGTRKSRSSASPKRNDSNDVRRSQLQHGLEMQDLRILQEQETSPLPSNRQATNDADDLGYEDVGLPSFPKSNLSSKTADRRALRTSALGAMRIQGPQMGMLLISPDDHEKRDDLDDSDFF